MVQNVLVEHGRRDQVVFTGGRGGGCCCARCLVHVLREQFDDGAPPGFHLRLVDFDLQPAGNLGSDTPVDISTLRRDHPVVVFDVDAGAVLNEQFGDVNTAEKGGGVERGTTVSVASVDRGAAREQLGDGRAVAEKRGGGERARAKGGLEGVGMGTGVEVPVDGVDVAACGGAPYRVFACAVRRGAEAVGNG